VCIIFFLILHRESIKTIVEQFKEYDYEEDDDDPDCDADDDRSDERNEF